MDAPTRSSNPPARVALVLAVLACLALPAAIGVAQVSQRFTLLQAAVAIPVAALLAIAALLLARRGRRRAELTLGRAGGSGAARAARVLGVLGLCLAVSGSIAVGFYEALVQYQ